MYFMLENAQVECYNGINISFEDYFMIKICNLNKVYKSKKRKKHHALKDISTILPDAGLVFVLGKSGSGKSTLLNLIGGLDSITSGKIEVDGNDISSLSAAEYANYRNSHIGFIFQDYHLIDELTVYENIKLALDLFGEKADERVHDALARVGLAGYETRFPSELSGGEQQRVAIARAIVKKPRIILADEPTGNLDTNTAKQVVEILKELSMECLILIVSHNVNDANKYADRIIELSHGEIISDRTKNPDFADEVTLGGGELIYPQGLQLSDSDIELINAHHEKPLVKKTDKFLATGALDMDEKRVKIEKKSLNFGNTMGLSGKFLKSKALAISFSAFMVAVIMVIMALAQTIITFDGGRIVAVEMEKTKQNSILLNKVLDEATQSQLDRVYPVKINESDIQLFYDAGYKGKIYPVYSHSLAIRNYGTYWGVNTNHFYGGVFMSETFGTIVVDEEFLIKKFGSFELIAEAETKTGYGIYITDYVADCVLAISDRYRGKSYEDILGGFYIAGYYAPRMYVNGIIKTDYKEKYGDILDSAQKGQIDTSKAYENEELQAFFEEIYTKLGFCYSINPNFINDFLNSSLSEFSTHYKFNVNGIFDYHCDGSSYVVGYDYLSASNLANLLTSNWCYYNECPTIPEGAKYIRVAFNDAIDSYYGIENDITTQECALLRFDNDDPISKELMNFHNEIESGVQLNAFSGEVESSPYGASASYVSDYIEIPEGATITEFASIARVNIGEEKDNSNAFYVFYDENKVPITGKTAHSGVNMEKNTIRMDFSVYNGLFGTAFDHTNMHNFVPHKITITQYENTDVNNENPLFEPVEVTIVGLFSGTYDMMVDQDLYELFKKDFVRPYFLYFDGTDGIGAVLDTAENHNFQPHSYAVEGIHTMTKAVDVFIPIFELVAIFLCIGIVFILMNFSSKMINDKMHEIGILKALGAKNSSIGVIFGLQVALIAILTCILATAGYYFFIDLANDVLIESLTRLAPQSIVLDLDFLTFQSDIALTNCALIALLTVISLVVPFIKIRFIEPVKIIKSKE